MWPFPRAGFVATDSTRLYVAALNLFPKNQAPEKSSEKSGSPNPVV
jgi:hypothetical protein